MKNQARKKAEGESVRGFIESPLFTQIIEPELSRRQANALQEANLRVADHAIVAKAIGAHGELVEFRRWLELKALDADIDLTQPVVGGPVITQD